MRLYRNLYAVTTFTVVGTVPLVSVYDWKLSSFETVVNAEFETTILAVGFIASSQSQAC